MPRFLENSFLGLNYVFSVQVWYICLNSIDLSKKKVHFVYSKQNLRPKNCLLEIGASNLEGPLLKFQYCKILFQISSLPTGVVVKVLHIVTSVSQVVDLFCPVRPETATPV